MLNQNSWGIVDESAAVLMMLFCSACLVPSFGFSQLRNVGWIKPFLE